LIAFYQILQRCMKPFFTSASIGEVNPKDEDGCHKNTSNG